MRERLSTRLVTCTALSVLLHVTVLWPGLRQVLAADHDRHAALASPPVPEPPEETVEPGIDESDARTLTWVGYDTYREHLARLSEVDQAAFQLPSAAAPAASQAAGEGPRREASGAPSPTDPAGADAPPTQPVEAAESADAVADPAQPATGDSDASAGAARPSPQVQGPDPVEPADPLDAGATPLVRGEDGAPPPLDDAGRRPDADAPDPTRPPLTDVAPDPERREAPDDADDVDAANTADTPDASDATRDAEDATAEHDPAADPAAEPVTDARIVDPMRAWLAEVARRAAAALAAREAEAGGDAGEEDVTREGAQPSPEPGDAPNRDRPVADRESPATSRIDVPREDLRPDRPISREGIEFKPRQPDFNILERVTRSPRNPVVWIDFGPDGVPVDAGLTRRVGDAGLDQAMVSSLFRWRATGRRIDALAEGETLRFEFRVVLNPRIKD